MSTVDGTLTRRRFMKIGAAGGVAAVGMGAGGPNNISAVGDGEAAVCGGICVGVAIAGGAAAVGLVSGAVAAHYLGDDRSDELAGTEETADLHRELRTRLIETHAANEDILTVANNRIEDARNVAWPSAKKEAVKARNNEETEQAAIDAAVAEIDAHYAQIQKNLLNRGTEWVNSILNIMSLHNSDSTLASDPVIRINGQVEASDSYPAQWMPTSTVIDDEATSRDFTVSLVDGTTYTGQELQLPGIRTDSDNDIEHLYINPTEHYTGNPDGSSASLTLTNPLGSDSSVVDPVDSGSTANWWDPSFWSTLWTSIQDDHSQMVSNANTFTTMLYQNTEPGEIDPSNWLSAETIASELSTDYETTGYHAYAAAEAAIAGIPGNFSQSMEITWEDDGITVAGSIWTEWAPASQTSTETETSTETATDDGTQAAGTEAFNVGETYDPDNTNKIVLVSYEYAGEDWIPGSDVWVKDDTDAWVRDESVTTAEGWTALEGDKMQVGYGELKQPFTIESAKDPESGESVDTVSTESKNHQTSDVGVTKEQMEAFLALAEEMRENESPGSSDGGGGLLGGDVDPAVVLVVIAGIFGLGVLSN